MYPIRHKIIFALIVFILLPSAFFGFFMLENYKNSMVAAEVRKLGEMADRKADQIAAFVDEKLTDVHILADSHQLIDFYQILSKMYYAKGVDSEEYKRLNALVHDRFNGYTTIAGYYDLFLISPQGDVIFTLKHESDFATNLNQGPYKNSMLATAYRRASNLLEPVFTQYRIYEPSSEPAAFLAAPLLEKDRLHGVVALQVNNQRFFEVVSDLTGLGETGETEAAQVEGNDALFIMPLRYAPDAAMKTRIPLDSARPSPVISALRGERGSGFSVDYRKKEVLAAWRYVPSAYLGMVVKVDADEALAETRQITKTAYLVLSGMGIMIILLGVYLARSFAGPLMILEKATASMAEGKLDQRVFMDRRDEIGQLAASFNLMAERLQSATGNLENKVQDRTQELERVNAQLKREIEDRKKIEEELHYTSSFQRAILDSANYSIISTDETGVIKLFNATAEKMLGYNAAEVIGKQTPAIFHDPGEIVSRAGILSGELKSPVEPGFEVFVAKARRGGVDESEWTYIRKDGSRFPVLLSVTSLKGEKGRIAGFLGVGLDITERKAAEEALKQARFQAEQANRYKSEFLASMSHEIRTPLNSIIGFSEVLMETPLNEEQKRLLQVSRSAGENLLYLINDILDLSKIEAGHIILEKSPFYLQEIIETCIEIISFRAKQKEIALDWGIDEGVETALVGDPGRLRQIILNLLSNAVKFSEGGSISLKVKRADKDEGNTRKMLFSVSDQGIGIPKEKQLTIFERFKQADATVTRKYGGTGLGLAISKMLVELMGGEICLESEPGKGSTFYFTAVFHAQMKGEKGGRERDLKGISLMVFASDDSKREELTRIVRDAGAATFEARSMEEAVDILRRKAVEQEPLQVVLGICDEESNSGYTLASLIRKEQEIFQPAILMISLNALCDKLKEKEFVHLQCKVMNRWNTAETLKMVREAVETMKLEGDGLESPEQKKNTEEREERKTTGLNILVVDDAKDNRLLVKAFLKSTPHQLSMAENGQMAVEMFQQERYDLVLMDVQMPVKDGYTATQEIRTYEKEKGLKPVPIIAFTAHAYQEDIDNSLKAGCNRHITKPIKKAVLLDLIDGYL